MDPQTAQFLQDTLQRYQPTLPNLPNYQQYVQDGYAAADQATRQAQAAQSIAASQQQMNFAAAQQPLNQALLQEKVDTLPLDKKYDLQLRSAQADLYRAQANKASAQGNYYGSPSFTMPSFTAPAPIQDDPSSGTSGTAPDPTPNVPTSSPSTPLPTGTLDPSKFNPTLNFGTDSNSGSAGWLGSNPFPDAAGDVASADTAPTSTTEDMTNLAPVGGQQPGDAGYIAPGQPGYVTPVAGEDDLPQADGDDAALNSLIPGYTGEQAAAGTAALNNADAVENQAASAGFRVPVSDADLVSQHNAYNDYAAQVRSMPVNARDAKMRESVLAHMDQSLARAEAQYRATARTKAQATKQSTRAAGTGGLPADVPPGFSAIPTTFSPRGLAGVIRSPEDVENAETQRQLLQMTKADTMVKGDTGGANIGDLFNDRGNYSDTLHQAVPGMHYFNRQIVNPNTSVEQTVEQSLPEDVYSRLRTLADPLYGRGAYVPMTGNAPASAAPVAPAPAATPLPRLRMTLGGAVPDLSTVTPAPASTLPPAGNLQQAAAQIAPQTDAEKAAAPILAARQLKVATPSPADVSAAAITADHKMLAYHMTQQLSPIDDAITEENRKLQAIQDAAAAGDPSGQGDLANIAQARILQKIQQLRAQRAAVLTKANYRPLPSGGFQYVDPYDANNLPTAFNQIPTSAGNVTVTKSQ